MSNRMESPCSCPGSCEPVDSPFWVENQRSKSRMAYSSAWSNLRKLEKYTFRMRTENCAGGRNLSPQSDVNIKLLRLRRLSKTNNETEFPQDQGLNLANWKI